MLGEPGYRLVSRPFSKGTEGAEADPATCLVDMISAVKHGEGFGFHGCQTLSDLAFGLDTHGD